LKYEISTKVIIPYDFVDWIGDLKSVWPIIGHIAEGFRILTLGEPSKRDRTSIAPRELLAND